MSTTLFKNARVITPTGIFPGEVLVREDIIAEVSLNRTLSCRADRVCNVRGEYLSPGFIDLHTHGAGGYDFMNGLDAIYGACRSHMVHGTTAIMPTTITGSRQELLDYVELFNRVEQKKTGCPTILGLHLEGPYFAANQAGAQNPAYLRNPEPEEYEAVLAKTDRIRRWSFAIELPGADRFLRRLREAGIVTSLAHSDATCDKVLRAYENGLSCLTHFYSCMATVRRVNAYRVAGAIEAGYLLDDLYVETIADGCHLPAELLQLIYKIKGPDRICLVTDSMSAAGMPDGPYTLGGLDVIKEDGVAKLADRSAFAGSVATTDRLVRTYRDLTDAPLYQVVKMASLTPARLMGIDRHTGSVCAGKSADLVVFDENVAVHQVLVRGELMESDALLPR